MHASIPSQAKLDRAAPIHPNFGIHHRFNIRLTAATVNCAPVLRCWKPVPVRALPIDRWTPRKSGIQLSHRNATSTPEKSFPTRCGTTGATSKVQIAIPTPMRTEVRLTLMASFTTSRNRYFVSAKYLGTMAKSRAMTGVEAKSMIR